MNEITAGQTRVGVLVDVDGKGSELGATLELVDGQVRLVLRWDRDDPTAYVESWFNARATPVAGAPALPASLVFHDEHGPVHLVRCYPIRWTHNPVSGTGTGYLGAVFVVLDRPTTPAESFELVTKMRSLISGMHQWMDVQRIGEENRVATDTEPESLIFTAVRHEPVAIPGVPGLTLTPSVSVTRNRDTLTLREVVYVETAHASPGEWKPLLAVHQAIRDLVAVSTWQVQHLEQLLVKPGGDPLDTHAWRQVLAPRAVREVPARRQAPLCLIEYADIGAEGVAAWIVLRETYARALDPVISILYREDVAIETALTSVSIGLEALAYALAVERSLPKPADMPIKTRLRLIAEPLAPLLPFDAEEWVKGTADAYNGLKHANRDLPDAVEVDKRARQSIQVVRAWVATELGVKDEAIKYRIANGRLT